MKTVYRNCPLCGSEQYRNLYSKPIFVRELEYKLRVVKCIICEFIMLNPITSKQESGVFYDNDTQRQFIKSLTTIRDPQKDILRRFEILKQYVPINYKVLDVGAGSGEFVKYAANKFNIRGIDVSARRIRNDNVFVSDIFKWQEKVDVITLFQVLEHIPEPLSFIHRIKELLNQNGILIVEVPNHNDLLLKNKNFRKFYYQSAHCSYFVPTEIYSLIYGSGFKLIKNLPTQRYGLDNHLHWALKNKPGTFKITEIVNDKYKQLITKSKYFDTIFMIFRKTE